MEIVPVIDLKNGAAVHAVRGKRDRYQPIQSVLVEGAQPSDLAIAYRDSLKCKHVYVADLDSITGDAISSVAIDAILEIGLDVTLDIGIADPHHLDWIRTRCERFPASTIYPVLALETISSPSELVQLVKETEALGEVVFSLDLRAGEPVAGRGWSSRGPVEIAKIAEQSGVSRMVILDIAAVGSASGASSLPILQQIRFALPELYLAQGGGVRNLGDLRLLANVGCDGAFVASALHSGAIGHDEIRQLRHWGEL